MKKRSITLLLTLSILAGLFASCGGDTSNPSDTTDGSTSDTTTETEVTDPLEGLNFGGDEFRVLVSNYNFTGYGSSIYTIRPTVEDETGDVVNDAVIKRNRAVEEQLGVELVFTENADNWIGISTTLNTLIMSGEDTYDLIIHALFPLATLSVQDYFYNVRENDYFDFDKDYWYKDYMLDLSFDNEDKQYLLAGDYFVDILRSAHAMYINKDMFESLGNSSDELYQLVFDGKWTQDKFLEYSKQAKLDDGDGKNTENDRYGYVSYNYWGPMMPWVVGADITYLEYGSDGAPRFAMDNERSVTLLERLNEIFHNDATINFTEAGKHTEAFVNGNVLFSGYQRVSSLESFRDMTTDIGILPYPKMDEAQESYITCSHDTACVGAIPITTSKFEMAGAVIEALTRESAELVMPAYYETALKVKYARDDQSVMMLDLIRSNMGDVFPLAFGSYCNNLPLNKAFSVPLGNKSTEFMSNYASSVDAAQVKLDELWDNFSKNK